MTKPYYADETVTLYHGDCREILPEAAAKRLSQGFLTEAAP